MSHGSIVVFPCYKVVEIAPDGGVSDQKVAEIKAALRDLGLSDNVNLE
jgi:hypothetical protein